MPDLSQLDWRMRHTLIAGLAARGRAPSAEEAGAALGLSATDAHACIRRLHDAHLLLLDDSSRVMMMHPFSNVLTDYRVSSGGVSYDANCAWDSLGIAAALHRDAVITAQLPHGQGDFRIAVRGGRIEAEEGFVHFLLPLRQWYDDLVYT